jgi:hypothetical protein
VSIRARLLLASALMLFLELTLIRWTGAQVVHLSYFSNFVLLGSFLGLGLGFIRANQPGRRRPYYSPVVLLGLIGFLSAYPVAVNREDRSVIFFTSLTTSGPPPWVVLPVIFLAVATIMAGPGELAGECFTRLPRLKAYRYDLCGSLIGITLFTIFSFLRCSATHLVLDNLAGIRHFARQTRLVSIVCSTCLDIGNVHLPACHSAGGLLVALLPR